MFDSIGLIEQHVWVRYDILRLEIERGQIPKAWSTLAIGVRVINGETKGVNIDKESSRCFTASLVEFLITNSGMVTWVAS